MLWGKRKKTSLRERKIKMYKERKEYKCVTKKEVKKNRIENEKFI
jgi:hypothetical protein